MGAVISRVSTPNRASIEEHGNDECMDGSCIRDSSKFDAVATEIIDQKDQPDSDNVTNGDDDGLVTTVGHVTTGGILPIRRVTYYFTSHWQQLFLVFRSWSVKDFFIDLWVKISRHGKVAIERLKVCEDESTADDNLRKGLEKSDGQVLNRLFSRNERNEENFGSYESSDREKVCRLENELKYATLEKAHLRQALERANKALDGMKSAHIRHEDEILELRHLIVVVKEFHQSFRHDMASIKDQTDQVINEYDEKLDAMTDARDQTWRKLKEAEDMIGSLNTIIKARDTDLSKALARQHALKERLDPVELELQKTAALSKKRGLAANGEVKSKITCRADGPRPEGLPPATDTSPQSSTADYGLLHALYLDALARATSLETQNNALRESTSTIATPDSHSQGLQCRQPRGPAAAIRAAPTELIVIGVDVGRSVSEYLPSIKAVYRTMRHYISLNNGLAQLATVVHGCRGSHDVFVGPMARLSMLSPDTLELVQPRGTANYERCLDSAYNIIVSNRDFGSKCRKVVFVIGHAMDQTPSKSLGLTCRRCMSDGIQVHSITIGSAAVAEGKEDNLGVSWVAEKAGGRDLSESSYLAALPELLRHDG